LTLPQPPGSRPSTTSLPSTASRGRQFRKAGLSPEEAEEVALREFILLPDLEGDE
jgi:hypothetical protein